MKNSRHNYHNSQPLFMDQESCNPHQHIFHERKHSQNYTLNEGKAKFNLYKVKQSISPNKSYVINGTTNTEENNSYIQRPVSPLSQFSPSGCDVLNSTGNIYAGFQQNNCYDMTNKSFNSGVGNSTGGASSVMNEVKSLIVRSDQLIQSKLKALTDFKDTLTGSGIRGMGPPTKESFNKTKMIGNERDGYSYMRIQQNHFSPKRNSETTEENLSESQEDMKKFNISHHMRMQSQKVNHQPDNLLRISINQLQQNKQKYFPQKEQSSERTQCKNENKYPSAVTLGVRNSIRQEHQSYLVNQERSPYLKHNDSLKYVQTELNDMTQPTNYSQTDISPAKFTLPSQILSRQSNVQSIDYQASNLQRLENEMMQVKLGQRESHLIIGSFVQKLDQSEENMSKSFNKSVERIVSQLEGMQHNFCQRKIEEEEKYQKLYAQVTKIKHHYKKRSKRHSKQKSSDYTNQMSRDQIYQSSQYSKAQLHNQQLSYQKQPNCESDTIVFHQQDDKVSAYFGGQTGSKRDTIFSQNKIMFEDSSKIRFMKEDLSPKSNQESSVKVIRMNKILSNNGSNCNDKLDSLQMQSIPDQKQHLTSEGNYHSTSQQIRHNASNGQYTISFNMELEKVKEESSKRIQDLKFFYDGELQKMREEFQLRELSFKDSLKFQIQEEMNLEKQKMFAQMQSLQKEKAEMEKQLQRARRTKHSSNSSSMNSQQLQYLMEQQQYRNAPSSNNTRIYSSNEQLSPRSYISSNEPTLPQQINVQIPHLKEMINNCGKNQKRSAQKHRRKESQDFQKKKEINASHKENTVPVCNQKGEGLMVKEKEIFWRINKLENYLNKP